MYASTDSEFYRSIDTGDNWTQITAGLPTNGERVAIGVTPDLSTRVYLLFGPSHSTNTFVGFYRSTNSGQSFNLQTTTPNLLGYSSSGNDDDDQTSYDHAVVVNKDDYSVIVSGGINCWKSTSYGQNGT